MKLRNIGPAFDRVILADPALQGNVGHYLAYATEVGAGIRRAGYAFQAVGTRDTKGRAVALLPGMDEEAAFERDFNHSVVRRARVLADRTFGFGLQSGFRGGARRTLAKFAPAVANFAAYREFRSVLRPLTNYRTLLFLPTIDHRYAAGMGFFLRGIPPSAAPAVCMLWRFTYFDSLGQKPRRLPTWPRLAFRVLESLTDRYRIRIAVESERLAHEYRWLTRLPINVLPIPLSDISVQPSPVDKAKRTIVCLGDARAEKGFETVVDAIELLRRTDIWKQLQFVIQCNTVSDSQARMVSANLPRLEGSNIRLIHSALPRNEYEQVLADSDMLLLPYDRRVYWARTSYPLAEGMAIGKPVIATSNTWMSEQISHYGSGLTIEGDARSAAEAVMTMVASYPTFARRATAASREWRRNNNADVLATTLITGLSWT